MNTRLGIYYSFCHGDYIIWILSTWYNILGEVNAAEKFCTAGKVVLSPNALELADRENIIVDPLADRFSLIRYLRRDPRKHWKDYVELPEEETELTKG